MASGGPSSATSCCGVVSPSTIQKELLVHFRKSCSLPPPWILTSETSSGHTSLPLASGANVLTLGRVSVHMVSRACDQESQLETANELGIAVEGSSDTTSLDYE